MEHYDFPSVGTLEGTVEEEEEVLKRFDELDKQEFCEVSTNKFFCYMVFFCPKAWKGMQRKRECSENKIFCL